MNPRRTAIVSVAVAVAVVLSAAPTPAAMGPLPAEPSAPAGSSQQPCGSWGAYGADVARTFEYDCPSAISPSTASTLAPLWVFKTEQTVTASPTVVDGTVFVGDWSATMYALDADTGAERWRFAAFEAPGAPFGPIVATAAVAAPAGGRDLVVFGSGPVMHALDARTGTEVWSTYVGSAARPEAHPADEETEFESSPVIWDGIVYSGLDVHGRTTDENDGVRGGILAFDLGTGEVLGSFDVEHDFLDARTGARLSGCSSVWSSPTLDVDAGTLFFATGNCSQDLPPGTGWGRHIEAITAIDLDPSSWAEPGTATRWTFTPEPLNRDDTDFGATPNLFVDATGRTLLGVGKKDAVYYALDPGTGEVVWATQVTQPGNFGQDFAVGGFIGSTATGRGGVFGGTAIAPAVPYFHALDGATGTIRWTGVAAPTYAASAFVNEVVLAGALDNALKAWDARSGRLLWTSPLLGPISSGPSVVGDRVYVGSGTSSSDLCAKDTPGAEACLAAFEEAVGRTGGIHAFGLAAPGQVAAVGGTATGSTLVAHEGGRTWAYDLESLEREVTGRADPGGQVCLDAAGRRIDTAGAPGCGTLPDGRLAVATADGRLLVGGCAIAEGLGPARGMTVDEQGRIIVVAGQPAAIKRFSDPGCGARAVPEVLGGADPRLAGPTAVAGTGRGGFYVATAPAGALVASGLGPGAVVEVDEEGRFVRYALDPLVAGAGVPVALALDADGALYLAASDGTVRRIRMGPDGRPLHPEILNAGLDGSAGLGLPPSVAPVGAAPAVDPGRGAGATTAGGAAAPTAPSRLPATGGHAPIAVAGALVLLAVLARAATSRAGGGA